MKENKLSWVELRKMVAKRSNATEQEANLFMNTLVAQIIEGLQSEQQVRIAGLGSFRLQTVAPRKSVNVTTGAPIIIDSYNKLTFTPELGMKELVMSAHQPASDAPATPIQKLGAQANEIVDILADLGQKPGEKPKTPKKPKAPKAPKATTPEASMAPEVQVTAEVPAETPAVTPAPKVPEAPVVAEKPKKQYHPLRDGLITIGIILVLLVIGYFFLTQRIVKFADGLTEKIESRAPQAEVVEPEATEPVEVAEPAPAAEEPEAEPIQVTQNTSDSPRTYTQFITTEEMHADSRLAWMAYRYYGKKDLWVFIYEANMDHLSTPHQIPVGTPIRVPELTPELRDLNNPATRQLVDQLIERYK